MYVGKELARDEDVRFLLGKGSYVDDMSLPNMAHAAILRSPHAHARLLAIDTDVAARMPGVLAVLTIAEWKAAGLGILPCVHHIAFDDGRPMNEWIRPVFAEGKVCFVGDQVACVIAETYAQALDACEAVVVDYDPLPPCVETLVTETEETVLCPEMCAGFPAQGIAHQLVNRSAKEVAFLEIGDRIRGDKGSYPNDDVEVVLGDDGEWMFVHKDGRGY